MTQHTPERLRCDVCDMPTLGDTLCNQHYEEQERAMTQHTPGPWVIEQAHEDFPVQQVIHAEGSDRVLAVLDRNDAQDKANAALVAASPDLLRAIKRLRTHAIATEALRARESGNYQEITPQELLDAETRLIESEVGSSALAYANAAIAKAEGRI